MDPEKFALLSKDVRVMIDALKGQVVIAGGLGKGKPEATKNSIWFNGQDLHDEGHETFHIEPNFKSSYPQQNDDGKFFAFCKTARKPYDILVVATLCAARYRFGDEIVISSDGDRKDWQEGYDLWVKTCNPVDPDYEVILEGIDVS